MDVLGAAYFGDDIAWWENTTGDGTVWVEHTAANGSFDGAYSVYAADIDGDGDRDILGAAYFGDDITWWKYAKQCTSDFDCSGDVGTGDLIELLGSWGPCEDCPADFDGDGDVDAVDLIELLGNWGPCR